MATRMRRIVSRAAMTSAALIALGLTEAQATTFTFDDIVYVSCTNFRCSNGGSNFAAEFPGYVGPGYSSPGYYQVLQTNNGNFWSGLTAHGSTVPTYIFKNAGNGSTMGGEWIQNDPNFPTFPPLNGTESEDKLLLQGFSSAATGVNGAVVDKVYTTTANGSYFQFTAPTGIGNPTNFTFNSFDLSGSASNVTFEVLDSASNILFTSAAYNLTSTGQHIVVNIANAFKVFFNNGSSTPNALNVDNIEINDPVATPEPLSAALFGVSLAGLGVVRRRR